MTGLLLNPFLVSAANIRKGKREGSPLFFKKGNKEEPLYSAYAEHLPLSSARLRKASVSARLRRDKSPGLLKGRIVVPCLHSPALAGNCSSIKYNLLSLKY